MAGSVRQALDMGEYSDLCIIIIFDRLHLYVAFSFSYERFIVKTKHFNLVSTFLPIKSVPTNIVEGWQCGN